MKEAGLWANIWAKRRRGEKMRKKGEKGAPTQAAIQKAQEMAGGTTTSSVVGAGDNPSGTVVIDKRRRKHRDPRVLKRFRTYTDSDAQSLFIFIFSSYIQWHWVYSILVL